MAAHYFRKLGMATLMFDAYEMNKIGYLGFDFFNSQMTNESRQRMIFKVTRGAYEWAIKQEKIDINRIYFWGVSNGASVVVNMAAVVDPDHVKAIFAEGMPPQGLGLPNTIRVPVYLAYGELDDYGTRVEENERQWTRSTLCRENTQFGDLKNRNSFRCNSEHNRDSPAETVEQWFNRVKLNNQPVHFKVYKDAAHSFFVNGPTRGTHIKNNRRWGSSSGASQQAREEYMRDVFEVIQKQ